MVKCNSVCKSYKNFGVRDSLYDRDNGLDNFDIDDMESDEFEHSDKKPRTNYNTPKKSITNNVYVNCTFEFTNKKKVQHKRKSLFYKPRYLGSDGSISEESIVFSKVSS